MVLELIGDTLRAIFEYAKYDRSEFIDTITMAQSTQEDAEVKRSGQESQWLEIAVRSWRS